MGMSKSLMLDVVRHRQAKINHRQQHKHVRLNNRHAQMQYQEHQRHTNRNQREERQRHQIARKHIRVQTNRQRKIRAKCEMISIGSSNGYSHHTGPRNCLIYAKPFARMPW